MTTTEVYHGVTLTFTTVTHPFSVTFNSSGFEHTKYGGNKLELRQWAQTIIDDNEK